ncbi:unnamed protein product [Gulo gulo]|uniref:Uncharacterized protein n=1 Tax=Gulo gulo TaxID=48420 RepID=A0A9X9LU27_GULGU|nr:unnamed protein product [Gulo gulo]
MSQGSHPSPPRFPQGRPNCWRASFFFGKSILPFVATVLESPEGEDSPHASRSTITCDLAPETMGKQPGGQPGEANTGPQS